MRSLNIEDNKSSQISYSFENHLSSYEAKLFISLFERTFKMMKNGALL